MRKAVFTFGRFNPPTIGHKLLLDKVEHHAHKHDGDHYVFASKSHDNKKNPLEFNEKVEYLKVMFPNINFENNENVKNPFDAIHWLCEKGYTDITMIVGSDRVEEFEKAIGPYLNHADPKKCLKVESFKVVSAGHRDPDSDGIIGASSSKARQLVQDGKYEEFKQIIPIPDEMTVRALFTKIGAGLQPKKQMSEAEKMRELMNKLSKENLAEAELPLIEDIDVTKFVKRYKEFTSKVLEAKDPYQVLRQFDKSRTAAGKKPMLAQTIWKIEELDPATYQWNEIKNRYFTSKKEAHAWAEKNVKGRFDISMK